MPCRTISPAPGIQFKKNGLIDIGDKIERIVSEIMQIPYDAIAYCIPMSVRDYNHGAYISRNNSDG
jgi:hypothetical protein